jgi:hypothetical protein
MAVGHKETQLLIIIIISIIIVVNIRTYIRSKEIKSLQQMLR